MQENVYTKADSFSAGLELTRLLWNLTYIPLFKNSTPESYLERLYVGPHPHFLSL